MCHRAETSFACAPASVAQARHWASDHLAAMYEGRLDPVRDVELVVSELVTNCVQAQAHQFVVAIETHHTYIKVSAHDDAPGVPAKRAPPVDGPGGRGLVIVEALSRRWGVTPTGPGKTVWAEFPVPVGLRPTFTCAMG